MTKDEALNIAIDYMNERLEEHDAKFQRHPVAEAERNNILADIEAVKEALAQPEQDNTYIYASNLAKTIWQKHYMKESPKFALFDTTEGVLTQIDNMTCGLVREKPAQPEQEPVAWLNRDSVDGLWYPNAFKTDNLEPSIPLYTTPPQRTWVGLTDEEWVNALGKVREQLNGDVFGGFYRVIEAKLKEKNT